VGRRRLAARRTGDGREGPGSAHHDRRAAATAPSRSAPRRRSPRDQMGGARLPRARRVVVRARG
jgi:hypothetical protein